MSNRDAVKHLLSVLKGHMRQMVVVIFCIVISAVIGLSMPLLSRRIMDEGFVG